MFHRPQDRALPGEAVAAAALRLDHAWPDLAPGLAGARVVDAGDAEHQRRVQHLALVVALLPRRAGPGQQVAVAGGVDKDLRADRTTARSRLDQQGIDLAAIAHRHADRECMEQQPHVTRQQQFVGRALVGGAVVGLGQRAAEDRMRLVQPAQRIDALEQFVGHAMHHAPHLAMHVGMQAAEVGDTSGRAHAAQEAVALDQQHIAPGGRCAGRGGNAGRAAAQDQHLGLGQQRRAARGFGDRKLCAHRTLPTGRDGAITGLHGICRLLRRDPAMPVAVRAPRPRRRGAQRLESAARIGNMRLNGLFATMTYALIPLQ